MLIDWGNHLKDLASHHCMVCHQSSPLLKALIAVNGLKKPFTAINAFNQTISSLHQSSSSPLICLAQLEKDNMQCHTDIYRFLFLSTQSI